MNANVDTSGVGTAMRNAIARALSSMAARVLPQNAAPLTPPPPQSEEFAQFPGFPYHLWGAPWFDDPNKWSHAKAAASLSTAYACITRIADDVASLPIRFFFENGDEREYLDAKHPIRKLWRKPSPQESGFELRRGLVAGLLAGGNDYLYQLWDFAENGPVSGKIPSRLYVQPHQFFRPIPGPNLTVRGYWYEPKQVEIEPSRIIHFKLWNPAAAPGTPVPEGLSPLAAARMDWETRWLLSRMMRETAKSGGQLNHLFASKDPEGMTAEERAAAIKDMKRDRATPEQGADPIIIRSSLELIQRGITPRDMMFLEAAQLADVAICNVYRVPPLMIGIRSSGLGSQAGAQTDFELYGMGALMPMATLLSDVISTQFCERFEPGLRCEIDWMGYAPIQTMMLGQAKAVAEATGRFPLSLQEGRRRMPNTPPAPPDARPDEFFVESRVQSMKLIEKAENAPTVDPASVNIPAVPDTPKAKNARAAKLSRLSRSQRREKLRAEKNQDLARFEKRVEDWAYRRIRRQRATALQKLEGHPLIGRDALKNSADRPTARFAYGDDLIPPASEEDYAQIQAIYDRIVAERGHEAGLEVGVQVSLDVRKGKLRELILSRSHEIIRGIDHTTAERLNAALIKAIEGQEHVSFNDLWHTVSDVFDGRANNAETIARTETSWAYNTASWQAWKESNTQWKSWLTLHDSAVRESHADCEDDGIIAMDQPFSNGLLYPGDPDGDASEVCNCRCVLIPELSPSGDASGEDTDDEQSLSAVAGFFLEEPHRNGHGRLRALALDDLVRS